MSKKKNIKIIAAVIAGLFIINVIATTVIVHLVVKSSILKIEYAKVGGQENYELINSINLEQIQVGLEQYKQQGGAQPQVPQVENTADKTQISVEAAKALKNGAYILGNAEAKISFIEYSDLECPYCARLHNSGTIEQILTAYPDDVNFIFKHYPLPNHAGAKYKAEVAECVGSLGGTAAYHGYVNNLFKGGAQTALELAEGVGVDADKVAQCVTDGTYKNKVLLQQQEGASFGVTGTPGNVLINNQTGEYKILPGAYPFADFKAVIDGLLK